MPSHVPESESNTTVNVSPPSSPSSSFDTMVDDTFGEGSAESLRQATLRVNQVAQAFSAKDDKTFSVEKIQLSVDQQRQVILLREGLATGTATLNTTIGALEVIASPIEASGQKHDIPPVEPLVLPENATQQEKLESLKAYYVNLQKLSENAAMDAIHVGNRAVSAVGRVDADLHNIEQERSIDQKGLMSKIASVRNEASQFEQSAAIITGAQDHIRSAGHIISALAAQPPSEASEEAARATVDALEKAANQLAAQLAASSSNLPAPSVNVAGTLAIAEGKQREIPLLQQRAALEQECSVMEGKLKAEKRRSGDMAETVSEISQDIGKKQAEIRACEQKIAETSQPQPQPSSHKPSITTTLDQVAPTVLAPEVMQHYQQDKDNHARHVAMFKRAIYESFCEKAIIANAVSTGQVERPKDSVDSVINMAKAGAAKVLPMGAVVASAAGYLANYQHNKQENQKHSDFAQLVPASQMHEIAENLATTMSYQLQEGASQLTEAGLQQLAGTITSKVFEGAATVNPNEPLNEQFVGLAYAASSVGVSTLVEGKDSSKTLSAQGMLEEVGVRTEDGKCYGTDKIKYGFRHGTTAEVMSGKTRYVSLGYSMDPSPHNVSAEAVGAMSLQPKATDINLEQTLDHIKAFKAPGSKVGLGEGANKGDTALFKRTAMETSLHMVVSSRLEKDGFILNSNDPEGWKRYVQQADVETMLHMGGREKVLIQNEVTAATVLAPAKDSNEPDRLAAPALNSGLKKLEQYGVLHDIPLSEKDMRKSLQQVVEARRQEKGKDWQQHITPADIEQVLTKRDLKGMEATTLMQMTGITTRDTSEMIAPSRRPSFGDMTVAKQEQVEQQTEQQINGLATDEPAQQLHSDTKPERRSSVVGRAGEAMQKAADSGLATQIREDIQENVKETVISATLGEGLMADIAGNLTLENAQDAMQAVALRAQHKGQQLGIIEKDDKKFTVETLPSLTAEQAEAVIALRTTIQQNTVSLSERLDRFEQRAHTSQAEESVSPLPPLTFSPQATQQEQLAALSDYYSKLEALSQGAARKLSETGRGAVGAAENVDKDLYNLSNNRSQYVDRATMTASIDTVMQQSERFERGAAVVTEADSHIQEGAALLKQLQAQADQPTLASRKAIEALQRSANALSGQLQDTVLGNPPAMLPQEAATALAEAGKQQQKAALLAEKHALAKQQAGLQGELQVEQQHAAKAIAANEMRINEKTRQITANTQRITEKDKEIEAKQQPAILKAREVAAQQEMITRTQQEIAAKQEAAKQKEEQIKAGKSDITQKEAAKKQVEERRDSIKRQPVRDVFRMITFQKTNAQKKREAEGEVNEITGKIDLKTKEVTQLGKDQEKLREEEKTLSANLPGYNTQLDILKKEQVVLEEKAGKETETLRAEIAGINQQNATLQKEQQGLEAENAAEKAKVTAVDKQITDIDSKLNMVDRQLAQLEQQQPSIVMPRYIDTSTSKALHTALNHVEQTVLSPDSIQGQEASKEEQARQTAQLKRAIYNSFCEKAIVSHAINSGKVDRPQDMVDTVLTGVSAAGVAVPIAAPAVSAAVTLAQYGYDQNEQQKYANFAQAVPIGELHAIAEQFASTMSYQLQEAAGKLTDKGVDQLASSITTKVFEGAGKVKTNEPVTEQLTTIAYAKTNHLMNSNIEAKDSSQLLTAEGMLERIGVRDEQGNCYSAGDNKEEKYGFRYGTADEIAKAGNRYTKLDYQKAPSAATLSQEQVREIALESKRSDIPNVQSMLEDIKSFKAADESKGLGERANKSNNWMMDQMNKAYANVAGQGTAELFKVAKMQEDLKQIVTERLESEGFTLKESDSKGWERYVQKTDVAEMLQTGERKAVLEALNVTPEQVMQPKERAAIEEKGVIPEPSVNMMLDKLKKIGTEQGKRDDFTRKHMNADLEKIVNTRLTSIGADVPKEEWRQHVTPEDMQAMLEKPNRAIQIPPRELMQMVGAAPIAALPTAVSVTEAPVVAVPVAEVQHHHDYVPRQHLETALKLIKEEGKAVLGEKSHTFDRNDSTVRGPGIESDLRRMVKERVRAEGKEEIDSGDKEKWKGLVRLDDIKAMVKKRAPDKAEEINSRIEGSLTEKEMLEERPQRRDPKSREMLNTLTGDREIWTPEQRAERTKMADLAKTMGGQTGAKGEAKDAASIQKGDVAISDSKAAALEASRKQAVQ